LEKCGIKYIVNACPGAFGFATNKPALGVDDGFKRLDLDKFVDSADQSLDEHLDKALLFIDDALASANGGGVLIHCAQGVSRSSSIIIYYLMKRKAMSFDESLKLIRKTRPIASPNSSFENQLRKIERALKMTRGND
jgi:protein-tyrosine phosphatase